LLVEGLCCEEPAQVEAYMYSYNILFLYRHLYAVLRLPEVLAIYPTPKDTRLLLLAVHPGLTRILSLRCTRTVLDSLGLYLLDESFANIIKTGNLAEA